MVSGDGISQACVVYPLMSGKERLNVKEKNVQTWSPNMKMRWLPQGDTGEC
jgi:hypothetical protein